MIARAAETSPASIFNLFESKDALLNSLIAYTAGSSFDFYKKITSLTSAPDVVLYKSIYEEVLAIATAAPEIPALVYLPELNKPGFEVAQQVRADMVNHYYQQVAAGIELGIFNCVDPQLAAEQVFQLTETSILAGPSAHALAPAVQALGAAQLALRGLLVDATRLGEIAQRATAIDICFEPPTEL